MVPTDIVSQVFAFYLDRFAFSKKVQTASHDTQLQENTDSIFAFQSLVKKDTEGAGWL